ncbi:helix-turn-helix transcriptional regulator [Sphingomonas sp. AP4-R1]|uniref:PadR family transcriptional regulator n=1 Tax=Sphingomonas sp. AP4-R1 TaxID=2735134 RepID=UPI001493B005|nr:PadR family transcriptional regulator [Sphingomonas sp. AP4-R1]QJU57899.1 helix-turn-helix transcriptional regulator [Sphingomonas sp. AP4-R1]
MLRGFGHHHHFGPRGGGGFRRGPFEFAWSFDGDRGFRGGGGRRRVFDGEELKLVLLALLAEEPRHGYDLIRQIEERTGGAYAPSPGVVYPTLTLLDEMDLIEEVKEEGARRRFRITATGTAWLEERREQADALLARLSAMGEERNRTDHAPIRRAMTNLKLALREAAMEAEGDEGSERGHAIAEILDEAARKIERL